MAMLSREDIYTVNNVPRSISLFLETCKQGIDKPIFTLSPIRTDYINFHNLFIKLVVDDPSEATLAEEVFGNLDYWVRLNESRILRPYFDKLRHLADIERKRIAFNAIMKEVKEEGRSSFTAAKYLIEEPWKDKKDPKVKRESKDTTNKAYNLVENDVERLKGEGLLN